MFIEEQTAGCNSVNSQKQWSTWVLRPKTFIKNQTWWCVLIFSEKKRGGNRKERYV